MPKPTNNLASDIDPAAPANSEQLLRQQAIKHIERKRRFRVNVAVSGLAMTILVIIWAVSEYNNAGGWPTDGFSQSSSIPHVWNMWIAYPLLAWVVFVAADGWATYLRKPISETQIKREIDRQTGRPVR
jgi:hypothetical protein